MNEELNQKIEKVMSEWKPLKAEYALPNNTVPITDFWTVAYDMAEIIKELTEREAKLISFLNKMKISLNVCNDAYSKFMHDKIEATLSELGVK